MVRNLSIYILILFFISSCCYTGRYSEYGYPRKSISSYKQLNNSTAKIDTTIIYKLDASFINTVSNYYKKEDESEYPNFIYLKYYAKNKVGLFIIDKLKVLERDDFNPKKAKMGYFFEYENGNIKQKISTIGDCTLYISKHMGYTNNDSIVFIDKNLYGDIYKKVQLPKEFLENWQPDW